MSSNEGDSEDQNGGSNGNVSPEPRVVRVARRGQEANPNARPEPELHETVRGSKPGSKFVRITRNPKLRRVREGEYEATREVLVDNTKLGRFWDSVRGVLIGRPLASSELSHERLTKTKALAIFSSDNLSSSAYATEEMLLVLILAGTASLHLALPIAVGIAFLAAVVATSYVQLVKAYPGGGGAYAVTKENLGVNASLLIGATLFVDYVLTVAVSTASGVAAITSALPELHDVRIEMAAIFVTILTLVNLRGMKESGSILAIPPYLFILGFGGMIVVGVVRIALGHDLQPADTGEALEAGTQGVTIILLLRAFSSGAAALTGIEAIADGVPSFRPPESKNASITLIIMASILASFFVGVTFLATQLDIVPSHDKTVVAQIASAVFGEGIIFYFIQIFTAMILVLAANTAFAGLPTLASVMAKDRVMPTQFAFRGDRLAFSNGIIVLGVLSVGILIAFSADTHKIIPLYAFGVFMAFTLSQAGMVIHWRRARTPGWRMSLAINMLGCVMTGVVGLVVGGTKFSHGAWLSMLAMGVIFVVLYRIKAHYVDAKQQLSSGLEDGTGVAEQFYFASAGRPQTVIVPVESIDRSVLRTIAYARTLSPNAVAIHVTDERDTASDLRKMWDQSIPDMPLVIVESPYRSLIEPIMAYIEGMDRTVPNQMVTVVLPEYLPKHFWERSLHNQLASKLKKELMARPNTVVVEVPFHFH